MVILDSEQWNFMIWGSQSGGYELLYLLGCNSSLNLYIFKMTIETIVVRVN
jgi:hypothetical protein